MYCANLTNPKLHDPANFVYIVHGIMDYGPYLLKNKKSSLEGIEIDLTEISDVVKMHYVLQKIRDPEDFYSASLVGRLSASRAKEILSWGGGELSHLATFGNFGFIMKPEDTDIWVAWHSDIGVPRDKQERKEFAQKFQGRKKSVYDLMTKPLEQSNSDVTHNELLIKGNPSVEIVGLFYKSFGKKSERKGKISAQIALDTLKKEIPIIRIPGYVGVKKYDKDPKIREQEKHLDSLRDSIALSQALLEFKKGDF